MTEEANDEGRIPVSALILGVLGLIPFVGLSGLIASTSDGFGMGSRFLHMALATYAALIASFLGGVRWGNALSNRSRHRQEFTFSVLPSLVGWLALATSRPYDLMMLAGVFLALGVSDVGLALSGHAPRWYARLRVVLTSIVVLSLLTALAAQF
jgi:Protein of unknown function (DUF3429)